MKVSGVENAMVRILCKLVLFGCTFALLQIAFAVNLVAQPQVSGVENVMVRILCKLVLFGCLFALLQIDCAVALVAQLRCITILCREICDL